MSYSQIFILCCTSLHTFSLSRFYMYLLNVSKCVFIADGNGKAHEGLNPVPVAPTVPRVRLTMNHLVFHKVLGKGSFGKVGRMFPIY